MFARQHATLAATQRTRKLLEVNAGLLAGGHLAAARVAPDEVGASLSTLADQRVDDGGAGGETEHQWRVRKLLRRVLMATRRLRTRSATALQ